MTSRSEPEPNYWEIRRELDIQHDKMVEEFAQRNREWDRRRNEIKEILRWSTYCSNMVYILMRKGYVSSDLWFDLLNEKELTAYLPVEIGPTIEKVISEGDTITLQEIFKLI
jgi:hypothetical protein